MTKMSMEMQEAARERQVLNSWWVLEPKNRSVRADRRSEGRGHRIPARPRAAEPHRYCSRLAGADGEEEEDEEDEPDRAARYLQTLVSCVLFLPWWEQ